MVASPGATSSETPYVASYGSERASPVTPSGLPAGPGDEGVAAAGTAASSFNCNSARPGDKPVIHQRVMDCGGKRRATPLLSARDAWKI